MSGTCSIDGLGPLPLRQPATVAELGEAVRDCASRGQAVYPVGGGTKQGLGLPPERPGMALGTTRLDEVIDYPARDMTVTVRAGLTLRRLQELLAGENQRMPVDVPDADRATVGGVLAANVSGPRRYGFGTLRDQVIGIGLVNDQGQETRAGGRVVKNVAGYDLAKLYIGSLGTLGIITQVTFKVRPRPEASTLVTVAGTAETVGGLLDRVHESRTRPVCVELLNGAAAASLAQEGAPVPGDGWVLVVGYEDSEAAVAWQVNQLIHELGKAAGLNVLSGGAAEPLWQALTGFPSRTGDGLLFKATVPPGSAAGFCRAAAGRTDGLLLKAHAGNGVVLGQPPAGLTLPDVSTMLNGLLEEACAAGGNLTLPRCPTEWKRQLPVWGRPRGDAGLMRRVKHALDPGGLFNPGRFAAGL